MNYPIFKAGRLPSVRSKRIAEGLQLLEDWIIQLLRQGFEVLQKDETRIQEMATRAVDCGMPAIGRRLRTLPDKIKSGTDWVDDLMNEIGAIYLFLQMVKAKEKQELVHEEDLLAFMGVHIKKSDLIKETVPIEDEWIYLGTRREKEENILINRHWFYGRNHSKFGLYIEFQVNRFVKLRNFDFGKMYHGYVHFYPSALPIRMHDVPDQHRIIPGQISWKAHNVTEYLDLLSKAILLHPFIRQMPALIKDAKVIKIDARWYLVGADGVSIELNILEEKVWKLMSYLMDDSTVVVGEYEDRKIIPLAVYTHGYIRNI
ncbi:MAG: hypothetical protein IPL25_16405 [Saprospiraceae bacterium]|nr:hypothetical protein [Candidatus Vicinibacter affinis]